MRLATFLSVIQGNLLNDDRPLLLRVDVAVVGIRSCGIELIRVGTASAN